jgi:uncharacterized membrane protein
MAIVDILFRWIHVVSAVLAVGGAFFVYAVLPRGIEPLDSEQREAVFLRCRRAFKLVVHPAILGLLVSGVYNTIRNWQWYLANPKLMHAFFGVHLLLALVVVSITLWLLAGREPKRGHRTWLKANVFLMLLTIAAGSCLKWARDKTMNDRAGGPPPRASK